MAYDHELADRLRTALRVAAEHVAAEEPLHRWVDVGVSYTGSLPPK